MKYIKMINLLVPLLTIVLAIFQAHILNKQTEILQAQVSASLIVKESLIFDTTSNSYNDETLHIINLGAPINNFEHDLTSILKITKTNFETGIKENAYLKVNYYDFSTGSSGGKDELALYYGKDNNLSLSNLKKQISSHKSERGDAKVVYDLLLLKAIKTRYLNFDGEIIDNYFINTTLTNKSTYEELINLPSVNILNFGLSDLNYHLITESFNQKKSLDN